MGKIKPHPAVKLIIGFIFTDENILNKAKLYLIKKFGQIDYESQILVFNHTNYYEKELGAGLKRNFISFKKLVEADRLVSIKLFTNKLEQKLCLGSGRRQINIDPGYIELSKLVLATTKDYAHRIYLRQGIYAEITLFYQDKSFRYRDWTYPDYRTSEYIGIFNHIRGIYAQQIG